MLPINRKYISYMDCNYPVHLMCTMITNHDFDDKYMILSKRPFDDLCDEIRHHFEQDPNARDGTISPSSFWVEVLDIQFETRKSDGQKCNMYLVGGTKYGLARLSVFNDNLTEIQRGISNFTKYLDYDPWEL